jgi:hypothetical protein
MSCRVERLTPLREYMLVAGDPYLDGNRVEKVNRPCPNLRGAGPTKEGDGTIHVSVDRDLTHKTGLRLLVGSPVW